MKRYRGGPKVGSTGSECDLTEQSNRPQEQMCVSDANHTFAKEDEYQRITVIALLVTWTSGVDGKAKSQPDRKFKRRTFCNESLA